MQRNVSLVFMYLPNATLFRVSLLRQSSRQPSGSISVLTVLPLPTSLLIRFLLSSRSQPHPFTPLPFNSVIISITTTISILISLDQQ